MYLDPVRVHRHEVDPPAERDSALLYRERAVDLRIGHVRLPRFGDYAPDHLQLGVVLGHLPAVEHGLGGAVNAVTVLFALAADLVALGHPALTVLVGEVHQRVDAHLGSAGGVPGDVRSLGGGLLMYHDVGLRGL